MKYLLTGPMMVMVSRLQYVVTWITLQIGSRKKKPQPEDEELDLQEQGNEVQENLEQQQEEIIQEKLQGQQIVEIEKPAAEVEQADAVEKVNPNQAPKDRNDVGY